MKYAHKDEWVTCEAGHKICRVQRDIDLGELWDVAALGDWQQPAPKIGEMTVEGCKECGRSWWNGGALCFPDGWRGADWVRGQRLAVNASSV